MKKIKEVVLHNYKSYDDMRIPLSDFTAFIGPSNSGKSTVIKAIVLCLYNEPSGNKYIRHGEKLCWVETWFDDNSGIRRTRGVKESGEEINSYELIYPDGHTDEYTNFGQGAVEPVVKFHGIPKVDLFGEEECLNISNQFSTPFLLATTAPKRGKMIGKMAKTDVADLALQNINLEVRRRKSKKKELAEELKDIKEELKGMKDLPNAESALDSLKDKLDRTKDIEQKFKRIVFIQGELSALNKRKSELDVLIQKEAEVNDLVDRLEGLAKLNSRLNYVMSIQKNLLHTIQEKDAAIKVIQTIDVEKLDNVQQSIARLVTLLENVARIQAIYEKLKTEYNHRKEAEKIAENSIDTEVIMNEMERCRTLLLEINQILSVQTKIDTEKAREKRGFSVIENLQLDYENKFQEYKSALIENKQCPVCQSELTEEKVATIQDLI